MSKKAIISGFNDGRLGPPQIYYVKLYRDSLSHWLIRAS